MAGVIELPGKRYKYRKLEYWAEQGMVRVVNEDTPDIVRSVSCRTWAGRAKMIGRLALLEDLPNERIALENAANNMRKVADEAAAQGDPTDPEVMLYLARHRIFDTKFSRTS